MLTAIPISNPTITADDILRHDPCWEADEPGSVRRSFAGRDSVALLEIMRSDISNSDKLWCCSRLLPADQARALACLWVRRTPLADGRTVWDLLTDRRSRAAVEVAERFCRDEVTEGDMAAGWAAAWDAAREVTGDAAWGAAWGAAMAAARDAAWDAAWDAAGAAAGAAAGGAARAAQVQLATEAIEESQGAA